MSCREGPDPADIAPGGSTDPETDPVVPEVQILDATIVQVNNHTYAQFPIILTNINYDDVVTVQWATSNGSATVAGGYYTQKTAQVATFSVGTTEQTAEVEIFPGGSRTGLKDFFVDLTVPVNCTIVDAQGRALYDYSVDTPPPPPPVDPINDVSYTGYAKPGIVYDQAADCAYYYACTGATCGSAMSALFKRNVGTDRSFNWKKLYRDAGGCTQCGGSSPGGCTGNCTSSSCDGENEVRMLKWLRDHGIQNETSGTFYKISSFQAITASTVGALVPKLKRVLIDTGTVYVGSRQWYTSPQKGWLRCLSCNNFVLRNPDGSGPNVNCSTWSHADLTSGGGHTWIITGWNNNKAGGAFEIQSTYGRDWGSDGRCYIPYSYLRTGWTYYKLNYGGAV